MAPKRKSSASDHGSKGKKRSNDNEETPSSSSSKLNTVQAIASSPLTSLAREFWASPVNVSLL